MANQILKEIGAEITLLFGKHLPHGWEDTTDALILGLNVAKKVEAGSGMATLAGLFPNGIGSFVLAELQKVTNDGLITLEMAKGAEEATASITDPQAKADAIMEYIVTHINELPADWQGKHWLNVAAKILESLLNISTTEANAIINMRYGKIAK